MRILQIVFLLSVCGCPQALGLPITDVLEIEKLSKDLKNDLFKMFQLLDEDVGLSEKVKGQRVLLKEFKVFNNKINMFNAQLEGIGSQVMMAIVNYTDIQPQMKLKLMEANENIDFINLKYRKMGTFIESKSAYKDPTLEQFARSIVSHSNSSIHSVLDRIHAIIAPEEDEDENYDVGVPIVFKILMQIMKVQANEMFCNMQMSWQHFHLHLYNTLALTELKGFMMMEFSYMLLKLHNKGSFAKEMLTVQKLYKKRSATTLKLTIEAVQSVPLEFWKCDPLKPVKNETYIDITELVQAYIENEIDVRLWRPCFNTCDKKKESNSKSCNDYKRKEDAFCKRNKPCNGALIDCQHIADGTVCLADPGTNRRYDYIQQDGKFLGHWKNCAHAAISSYGRFNLYMLKCDYCMCYCDEQGVNSDRFFSMRSSESDIDHNKVVTGLRFVKKNRIIHLQIQQGKLLPMGKIDVTTVAWRPVEDFRIDDSGVVDGQDYHTLTLDKRSFDLDDLVGKYDQLVTGVGFKMMGSHLLLQVRLTPFNFKTGRLLFANSIWRYKASSQDKKKLNLDKKDVPILDPDRSRLFSNHHMFLEFTHSDMDMDIAQTTVPFIDAQAVNFAQPVPLSGVGVMHKGSTRYGGFITLKIMTYNYADVLRNAYDDNINIYI